MDKHRKRIVAGTVVVLTASLFFCTQVFAAEVTVIGKVNDNYQIVLDDGTVYEVADNDMGNDLLERHTGKTVQVTGKVVESPDSGEKIINVFAYTVLDE